MIYGHTCLIVFMYTVRTILINTENKTNKKQKTTTTKQEEKEQKQHQNTLPHLKRERIKRAKEGGASGEMGMLVGVLLC